MKKLEEKRMRSGRLLDRIVSCFTYCKYDGGLWFRVYGVGLSVQDRSKHPALFSERNGHVKVLRCGKWALRLLCN
jgi:hypothetical protein